MTTELIWGLLVKGSLFVGIAAAIGLALRKTSAARRHAVWLVALAAALLVPVAEIKLPAWNVSPAQSPIMAPFVVPPVLRIEKETPVRITSLLSNVAAQAASPEPVRIPFEAIWWIGFLACLAWISLGLVRAKLLVRSGKRWLPESQPAKEILGGVPLFLVPGKQIPATAGAFRPVVLLPEEARAWDEDRLSMVLSHEMGHVHRRDLLWLLVSQAACALHFFNPLMWVAAGQMRKESEFACDDFVLSRGVEPTTYAQELLDIARHSRFQTAGLCGMARNQNVENRLRSIVDERRRRNWVSGRLMIGLLIGSLVVAAPVAALRAIPVNKISRQAPSWSKLPHIDWAESTQIAPNVFLAHEGVAGLPGGISVRLVGLATEQDDIWDLNSKPIGDEDKWRTGGPYWQGNVFHRWSHGSMGAAGSRKFIVEVESDKNVTTGFTSCLVEPGPVSEMQRLNPIYAGADDQITDLELKAHDPSYAMIELSIASRAARGLYRVGIADPNWTTVAEVENPYHGTASGIGKDPGGNNSEDACGIHLGGQPDVYFAGPDGHFTDVKLLKDGQKLSLDTARRVLLFDKDGQPIELPDDIPHDNNGYVLATLRAETFCRIAKIVLQTSPYRWAEFRDVPLRPDFEAEKAKRLDSGVRGTATGIAPGFTKKLGSGVTVSVEAITKPVINGNKWVFTGQPSWRADGEVLAKGVEIPDFPMETKVWGTNPLVHFQVGIQGFPEDANMAIHPTGQIDKNFWLYGQYDSSQYNTKSTIAAYLPEAKTADLEVGIASGAWRTIARQPINVAEQPEAQGKTRFGDTGISLALGDDAAFMGEDKRPAKMTMQPIKGMCRRFVAVLRTGKVLPLKEASSGMKGLEIYYIPARHGEATEAYNHILASEIKEIQLQVRPYEWVKFTGIALNHK